jgi:AraC-like DNA-binding protein
LSPAPSPTSKPLNALDGCVSLEPLIIGDRVAVTRWRCLHDGPALRGERWHEDLVLVIHCRGSSVVHQDRGHRLIGPGSGAFHLPGAPYRTSHPFGCGDEGVHVRFRKGLPGTAVHGVKAATGNGPRVVLLPARAQLGVQLLLRRLLDGLRVDEAEVEEGLLALGVNLARRLASSAPGTAGHPARAARHERLAEAAQAALAGRLFEPIRIGEVARTLGTSRFHLARAMKDQTGISLRRHASRLRLFAAADELAARRSPVSGVALRHGFYSHSHFASSFQQEFSLRPSAARDLGCSANGHGLGALLAAL